MQSKVLCLVSECKVVLGELGLLRVELRGDAEQPTLVVDHSGHVHNGAGQVQVTGGVDGHTVVDERSLQLTTFASMMGK